MTIYPGAVTKYRSPIKHPLRTKTLGVVIHWTVGHENGDLRVLTGGDVDVQFYVTKKGVVYQFMDADSEAWHGYYMANHYCVGIETEGSGEPWTDDQLHAVAKLSAWLAAEYDVPILKVDPSGHVESTFRGFFGHRDLSLGGERVDSNDHTDSVPAGTGWDKFLGLVRYYAGLKSRRYYFERILDGKTVLTWGPYSRKSVRNIKYALVKTVHPSWALRKYSK